MGTARCGGSDRCRWGAVSYVASAKSTSGLQWLTDWMNERGIDLWGVADLRGFATPCDETGQPFPSAVSFAIPMNARIMAGIQAGPTRAYAEEYVRVNRLIDSLSASLAHDIRLKGSRSSALAASGGTDPASIRAAFPHKTAATRAGLGWIGRNCQLITRRFGPWVRLGTVFTDMELPAGVPVEKGLCGACSRCVEACPAGALKGAVWSAGLPREEMLDAEACDSWKREAQFEFLDEYVCGMCSGVCPFGLAALR